MRLFFNEHFGAVYRYVLCRVDGNHADAEEIVGEVFYQAFRDLKKCDAQSTPDSWLRGIARHRVLDFYRKNKRRPVVEIAFNTFDEEMAHRLFDLEASEVPSDSLEREELGLLVELALSDLPSGYERVLRLKYVDERAVKDIAEVLKATPKAIEAKLHRARLAFRDAFGLLQQNMSY